MTGSEEKEKLELVYHATIDVRIYAIRDDMPSDWIRSKAEKEKKEQEQWRAREEKQKRDAELIRSLGPTLLQTLRDVIDEDIKAWNESFADRQIGPTEGIAGGFKVCKRGFPFGLAEITFNSVTLGIDVKLVRSTAADSSRTYDVSGHFRLDVNSDGRDIHLVDRRNSHVVSSSFSQIIIESVGDPNSNYII